MAGMLPHRAGAVDRTKAELEHGGDIVRAHNREAAMKARRPKPPR